jgi:hypothetical protein
VVNRREHRGQRGRVVLLLAAAVMQVARAEIIDRIAVSVGTQVITTSDLERQIRVAAFLSGTKPDFSAAAKRAVVEGMIEQKLIRGELESTRYPAPSPEETGPLLDKFKREHFKSDEEFQKSLSEYGITEQDLKDELLWERTMLFFVEDRFRPGVQVTDEDVRDYFEKVVAPGARAAQPGTEPNLDDYRQRIIDTLTGERSNAELDRWLKEARNRTNIVYHPETLQ